MTITAKNASTSKRIEKLKGGAFSTPINKQGMNQARQFSFTPRVNPSALHLLRFLLHHASPTFLAFPSFSFCLASLFLQQRPRGEGSYSGNQLRSPGERENRVPQSRNGGPEGRSSVTLNQILCCYYFPFQFFFFRRFSLIIRWPRIPILLLINCAPLETRGCAVKDCRLARGHFLWSTCTLDKDRDVDRRRNKRKFP